MFVNILRLYETFQFIGHIILLYIIIDPCQILFSSRAVCFLVIYNIDLDNYPYINKLQQNNFRYNTVQNVVIFQN